MRRVAVLDCLTGENDRALSALGDYLHRAGVDVVAWPEAADAVLVFADACPPQSVTEELMARSADVPVLLAGGTAAVLGEESALLDAAGVIPDAATPVHETRLRPGPAGAEAFSRMPAELVLVDSWLRIAKARDDVEVLLTAMAGLDQHPVLTWRPSTRVGLLSVGSRAEAREAPDYQRLVYRWLRRAWGERDGAAVTVGLLGYGAIGHEHSAAVQAVDGLALAGVCDRSPERVAAAQRVVPDVSVYDDASGLINSPDVDLVVISTPPNTHADWALQALQAGKHVVVEKPFCLSTAEADQLLAAAGDAGRIMTVYQNRRWDADYLALKKLVHAGAIGDLFHYESFVGGYGHPCNYWHSDEEVSGGAIFDWGSHFLDWLLDLVPGDVDYVSATAHKRVWHDVTNADHSRVLVRFRDGIDAEFVHSDLAAAMKPKWYVLGTHGAIVGHWRQERVIARDRVGNLVEDPLAAAESPAALTLHAPDGSVTQVQVGPAPLQPFHRELADLILTGAPMSVTPHGSRRNVAVMEAAMLSARDNGRPVRPL